MSPKDTLGPLAKAWVARDAAVISSSYTRSYPFVMERGQGCEAWDVDGRRYLDMTSGIAVTSTGHAHPRVVQAIQEQAGRFIHMSGTDFYYPQQIELAERLAALAPWKGESRVFYTNSGAESVEAAFKLARWARRRPQMLAYLGAFHGRTMGALSLGASKSVHRDGFAPLVPGVTHVHYPYCYRCPFHLTYPGCDYHCVSYIEKEILGHLVPANEVAALIFEPIQGEGGYVVPPDGYFVRLKELADKFGILLIDDEVQAGVGRTGKMWAIEHWGVEPDIIASAKGLASGMPLGAMIARAEVMTWPTGAHANTFGGNPISCAAALVTLDLLQEGMIANAAVQGAYLKQRLTEMMPAHPSMGDVRGLGLMVGAEFVADKATRQPAPALRNAVVQAAFEARLLLLGCGSNVVRFVPALNVTRDILDESLSVFDEVLNQVEQDLL